MAQTSPEHAEPCDNLYIDTAVHVRNKDYGPAGCVDHKKQSGREWFDVVHYVN